MVKSQIHGRSEPLNQIQIQNRGPKDGSSVNEDTGLRFDLHIHSSYSDGRDDVKTILDAALEKGLDGLAITDHDTMDGYHLAQKIVEENGLDLILISGVEVSTSKGHLLAFGIKTLPPAKKSPEETIDFVHREGGIAIVSHPYHLFRHAMYRIPNCDAVEVYNSKYIFGIANWWARKMALKKGLPMVAGSDAHMAKTVGLGVTIIKIDKDCDVLEAIKEGRVQIDGQKTPSWVFVSQMARWLKRHIGKDASRK